MSTHLRRRLTPRQILTLLVPSPRPWDDEPDHKEFEYKGASCEIKRHPTLFHLCGYLHLWRNDIGVELTQDLCDTIPFHGGMTFYECKNKRRGKRNELRYSIGFDCAHLSDLSPGTLIGQAYLQGAVTEAKIGAFGMDVDISQYKTMAFVEQELKDAVDWLCDWLQALRFTAGSSKPNEPKT